MTSPFIPFDTQYSAHTDLAIHPVTGVVYITVAFHPNNQGGYNCRVWSLPPPYTGKPTLIRDWVQGQYSVGPFGHGASITLPTGALLTCVPVAADSADVRPSLLVDQGASPAYALGGVGPAGPKGDKGDPGPAGDTTAIEQRLTQIETALANISQGDLDGSDRKALDWVKRLLGDLVGSS